MNSVHGIVSMAQSRLGRDAFVRGALRALAIGGGALLGLAILSRLLGGTLPWMEGLNLLWAALGLMLVVAVVCGAISAARAKLRSLAAASIIDQRLELGDRLSTAVAFEKRTDAMARAAVEDGVRTAMDPATANRLRAAFRLRLPDRWWLGFGEVLATLAVWLLIPAFHFAPAAQADEAAAAAARAESAEAIEAVVAEISQSEALSESVLPPVEGAGEEPAAGDPQERTADEVRRDALRKMAQMERKLDEALNGEKAAELEALKDALSKIDSPQDGAAAALGAALKGGDMAAAKEAMAQLQKEIESGSLDAAAKERLAEAMEKMAQQLSQAAQDKASLERSLQAAGMDPSLASNPKALDAAIKQAGQLNDSQKQALQKAAQACSASKEMCSGLSKACSGLSQQCKGGQGSKSDMAKAGQCLSQMEALDQFMQSAKMSKGACQSACKKVGQGMCNNQSDQVRPGMGGRGRGAGGLAAKQETATGSKERKEKVEVQDDEVIARQYIEGPSMVGESQVVMEQIVGKIGGGTEDAVDDEQVPPRLRGAHQHYFGELKKRLEAKMRRLPDATPAPAGDTK